MSKIPSKPEILDWIAANPTLTAKRDIAKAFGIKGAARIDLKRVLKELEADGHLEKRKRSYNNPDRLPPVSVLQITGPDKDGDLFAKPMEWAGEGVEPIVLVIPRASDPALGAGDRILARDFGTPKHAEFGGQNSVPPNGEGEPHYDPGCDLNANCHHNQSQRSTSAGGLGRSSQGPQEMAEA